MLVTLKGLSVTFPSSEGGTCSVYEVGYNGIPKTGFIVNVLNMYFQEYFPRAIRQAAEMNDLYPAGGCIYTTHPWLIKLYLDCLPYLFLSGVHLECPTESAVQEEAVLKAGLQISKDLDTKFKRKTTVLSQRDVPGLTISASTFEKFIHSINVITSSYFKRNW